MYFALSCSTVQLVKYFPSCFQEKLYVQRAPQFRLSNKAASKEAAQTELRPDLLTYQDGHFCSKEKSA